MGPQAEEAQNLQELEEPKEAVSLEESVGAPPCDAWISDLWPWDGERAVSVDLSPAVCGLCPGRPRARTRLPFRSKVQSVATLPAAFHGAVSRC